MRRLIALCALAAFSEQLTAGSRLKNAVRLMIGLIAARLILEAVTALPGALW